MSEIPFSFSCFGTDTDRPEFKFLCSYIQDGVQDYLAKTKDEKLNLRIRSGVGANTKNSKSGSYDDEDSDQSMTKRQLQFKAKDPNYPDIMVLPAKTERMIEDAVNFFLHYEKIFKDWNFQSIIPYPCVILNFHGAPGTGKTLAAHVFSKRLGMKIIPASYAQIASMYVGEGAKNLEALFQAAESQNAVLFLDEADALLSKRISGETRGPESSLNAMRGQLLICLEKFKGIVIMASNLIKNYDKAFETRITSIEFPMPDKEMRRKIWENHIPKEFPCEISLDELAEIDDICGRDIRHAVLMVAQKIANRNLEKATMEDFKEAIDHIKNSRFDNIGKPAETQFTPEENKVLGDAIKKQRELKKVELDSFGMLKEAIDTLISARLERNPATETKEEPKKEEGDA